MFYEQEYSNGIGAQIAEKVLLVMESVLQEASSSQQVIIRQDSQQTAIPEEQSELGMLLGHMQSPYVVIIENLHNIMVATYICTHYSNPLPVFVKH